MAHIKENNAYLRGSGAVFLAGACPFAKVVKTTHGQSLSPSLREG